MPDTATPDTAHAALVLDPAAQRLLFTEARTANSFTSEPVTDEQIAAIHEVAQWPPTMANTNPLRITWVRGEEAKGRLLPLMAEGNRAKTASAPAVAILAADVDFHEQMPKLFPMKPQMADGFKGPREGREPVARNNAWLQAGYFILGVRAAGLAAGPMLGFDADGIDAEFFGGEDDARRTVLVVNVGRPGEDPWFDRLPRLDFDEVNELL